jgi:hypothetical protein
MSGVDAICIVQNAHLDFENEAPRMGAIYAIASSLAKELRDGFFNRGSPSGQIDFECLNKTYTVNIRNRIDHRLWYSRDIMDFKGVPLITRVWAFQERLLARRVVHYTPSEFVWECKTHTCCECSGIDWPCHSIHYPSGTSLKNQYRRGSHI